MAATDKLIRTATPGVYKRGKRYCVRFRVGIDERKRYVATYEEARRLKATLTADIARGEHRELSRTAFEAYAREWVQTYTGRTTTGLRESTRAKYRWSIDTKAIPFFGDARLAEVLPGDVRSYVAWLQDPRKQKRTLAPATVHKHLAVIKLLFASAVEDGLLRSSPAVHIRVGQGQARIEPRRVRAMEREQLAAVLAAVDPDWRLFFELLAATGLRIGEALELRWSDIDFGAKRLRVSRQVSKDGVVSPPKTATGQRVVPLSTAMCQRLWRLGGKLAFQQRGVELAQQRSEDALLFTSPHGLHVDRRWLRRYLLDPATAIAGVPWVTFHTFRHTCASLLFAEGKSPKQVQIWLGHTDPAFTMRTYIHLIDDDALGDALDVYCDKRGAARATGEPHEARQPRQIAEAAQSAEVVH
jgi:integrase